MQDDYTKLLVYLSITFHNLRKRERKGREKKERKKTWNRNHLQILRISGCGQPSAALCLAAQSYPTLWDPMHCSPPGSSVLGDFPGKNTGVGCHALLEGIFPTQGKNPGLPYCRQILYHLRHQGSPGHCETVIILPITLWKWGISIYFSFKLKVTF